MRRALLAVVLAAASGCINWDEAIATCQSAKARCADEMSDAGAGDGADSGQGDSGVQDAGGTSGRCFGDQSYCRGAWCWDEAIPHNIVTSIASHGGLIYTVGEKGQAGCYDNGQWYFDLATMGGDDLYSVHASDGGVFLGGWTEVWTLKADGGWAATGGVGSGGVTGLFSEGSYLVAAASDLYEKRGTASFGSSVASSMNDVAGRSSSALFAAGANGAVAVYSGTSWQTLTPFSSNVNMFSVCESGGRYWAGGERAGRAVLASSADGTSWTEQPVDAGQVWDLACVASDSVAFVGPNGLTRCAAGSCAAPMAMQLTAYTIGWDGTAIYFGGQGGSVFRQVPGNSVEVITGTPRGTLYAAAGAPNGELYVGDETGWLRRRTVSGAYETVSTLPGSITGLWFRPDGGGGFAMTLDEFRELDAQGAPGSAAIPLVDDAGQPFGGNRGFTALDGRGDDVYAVGDLGLVAKWAPSSNEFVVVVPSGSHIGRALDVFVMPDGGAAVANDDGTVVFASPAGATTDSSLGADELRAIAGDDNGNLLAFGLIGGSAHVWKKPPGGAWSQITTGQLPNGTSVCRAGANWYVSDATGEVWRFSSFTAPGFVALNTPTTNQLHDIGCTANAIVAVGDFGTIVRGPP